MFETSQNNDVTFTSASKTDAQTLIKLLLCICKNGTLGSFKCLRLNPWEMYMQTYIYIYRVFHDFRA